jgi:transcriptional regulator with XRE-family HTH domain
LTAALGGVSTAAADRMMWYAVLAISSTSGENTVMAVEESSSQTHDDPAAEVPLGTYLREVRGSLGLSLRQVEAATDKAVSNGYLSQIESGDVDRPSPNVLFHLAEVYGIEYGKLMIRAGHHVPATSQSGVMPQTVAGVPLRALEELDEHDQQLLREYLAFLQSRKKHRK